MPVADVLLAHGFFGDRAQGKVGFNEAGCHILSVHLSKAYTRDVGFEGNPACVRGQVPHICIPDKDNVQAQALSTGQDISHKVLIPSAEWQSNATNCLTIITSEDLIKCKSDRRVWRFYVAFRLNEQSTSGGRQLRLYICAVCSDRSGPEGSEHRCASVARQLRPLPRVHAYANTIS